MRPVSSSTDDQNQPLLPNFLLFASAFIVTEEFRFLLRIARRHWKLILATVLFSLSAAIAEGFSIGLLIPFLQSFTDPATQFSTGIAWVDVHLLGSESSQLGRLLRICSLILIATWCRSLFNYFSGVYAVITRARTTEDLRVRIVDQLQSVALRYFTNTQGGETINSLTNEIGRLTTALGVIFNVITQVTMFLMYVGLMLWISWELALGVLFVFGVLSLALTRIIRVVRLKGEEITQASGRFTSRITEFLNAVRTVKLYNQESYERKRLTAAIHDLAETLIDTTKKSLLVQPISQAVIGTLLIAVVFFAVWFLVLPGKLDIAFLLAFLFALFRLMPTVHQLNQQRGDWAKNHASLANVKRLLDASDKPYLSDGTREAPALRDGIDLSNVDFEYEPGEPVLKDVSIRIAAGRTTALVGGSGAGKSTLVDLLPRLYDPTGGRILYDGTDLQKFRLSSLRDRIAVVSQSTFVFNQTVAANIAYGSLNASMGSIREAAQQANALEFIENMDDGFDTVLGDRGVRLSGGQRQRIAIARALLKDPEILILDEATSNLDSISERLVQESLETLMDGRTVIAIAHRLSTIENADWVVVLEDGRVVEQGPYEALLEKKGHLWNYHSIQFQAA